MLPGIEKTKNNIFNNYRTQENFLKKVFR